MEESCLNVCELENRSNIYDYEVHESLDIHELENVIKDLQAQKLEDVKEMQAMELELMEKTARLSSKEDESRCYCQIELDKSLQQQIIYDELQSAIHKKRQRQIWTSFIHIVLMIIVLASTLALAVRMELMGDIDTFETECPSILKIPLCRFSILSTVRWFSSRVSNLFAP